MIKTIFTVTALAATAAGVTQHRTHATHLLLKEESIRLEHTVTEGETTIVVVAESEVPLQRIQIRNPRGKPVVELRSDAGKITGFVIETEEADSATLMQNYGAGTYQIRALTEDGQAALGSAVLDHAMPQAPTLIYPTEGEVDVPTKDLIIAWVGDSNAAGYRVILEQGENDGLRVDVPAGTSAFRVPDDVLRPGMDTLVEIGTIGANGNITLYEVSCITAW